MKTNNKESELARVLRGTSTKSKDIVTKFKCHVCRQKKDNTKVLICINFELCHHTFCYGCIDRNFRTRAKKEYLKVCESNWPCFACRGLCKCKKCKKALVDELNQLNSERKGIEGQKLIGKSTIIEIESGEKYSKDIAMEGINVVSV